MSVKLTKGGSAAQSDVLALEECVRTQLPTDFRSFLSKHDGAEPEMNIFRIDEQNESGVSGFIPAKAILRERKRVENLPPAAVPIAWAEGGNFVILDTRNGEVQFWDHETADLTSVASSFESFLTALQPFNVDDVELKPGQVKSVWVDPDFLKHLGEE